MGWSIVGTVFMISYIGYVIYVLSKVVRDRENYSRIGYIASVVMWHFWLVVLIGLALCIWFKFDLCVSMR